MVTAAQPYLGPETIGAQIRSVSRARTLSDLYRWLSRADARDKRPSDGQSPVAVARDGLWKRLRREADTLLWLPDDSRGWILRAAVRLRRTIRSTDPHVVVSSGPPHGAHLAAWLATRGTNVPWFADLRDPWAFLVWPGHRQVQSWLASVGAGRLERLVATHCTGMIATTPALVGALAMSVLFTRQPEARSDGCTMHLVGELDRQQREALDRVTRELGLGASIKMYGALPRADALGVLARSHVAVVAAQGQDMMIPAKLYEAIAIGREVLVLTPSASATGIEAARLGARVVDPADMDLLAREVERLWTERHQPTELVSTPVGYDVVARQTDELLRTVSKFCL